MTVGATAYPGYGTKAVASCFQLSERQMQWLDDTGVIKPQKTGHRRIYTVHDALLVGIASELRALHCNQDRLKKAIRALAREVHGFPPYLLVTGKGAVRTAANAASGKSALVSATCDPLGWNAARYGLACPLMKCVEYAHPLQLGSPAITR